MTKRLTAVSLACAVTFLFTACAPGEKVPNQAMTQAISTGGIIPESSATNETPAPLTVTPDQETPPTGLPQETSAPITEEESTVLMEYCSVKAKLDALDIDKDMLEAAYRVGETDETTFRSQIEDLRREERELELQEDTLKASVKKTLSRLERPEGTMEELFSLLSELDRQDDQIDSEEYNLEETYRSGEISRETFLSDQTELIYREELLDREKDSVEGALKLMGWDD